MLLCLVRLFIILAAGAVNSATHSGQSALNSPAELTFAGQMLGWLHETYQRSNRSLNLEAVWTDAKAIQNDWCRTAVVYQPRSQLGGYCYPSEIKLRAFKQSVIGSPGRGGGC